MNARQGDVSVKLMNVSKWE